MQKRGSYPEVVFVFRDSLERGRKFFEKEWPEVRAIADVDGSWWKAFAIPRGSFLKLFGPSVFAASFRALFKGNFVNLPGAAPTLEPALFVLAEDGTPLFQHPFRHIGDHPDFAALAKYKDKR